MLDKDNKPLPTGKIGEVCLQGPNVTKGYLNRPEANKEVWQLPPCACDYFACRSNAHNPLSCLSCSGCLSNDLPSQPSPPIWPPTPAVRCNTASNFSMSDQSEDFRRTPGTCYCLAAPVPCQMRRCACCLQAFAGGWFHTGDQGFLDGDGFLTLTGRIKELINRGGEKISPLEVRAPSFTPSALCHT